MSQIAGEVLRAKNISTKGQMIVAELEVEDLQDNSSLIRKVGTYSYLRSQRATIEFDSNKFNTSVEPVKKKSILGVDTEPRQSTTDESFALVIGLIAEESVPVSVILNPAKVLRAQLEGLVRMSNGPTRIKYEEQLRLIILMSL